LEYARSVINLADPAGQFLPVLGSSRGASCGQRQQRPGSGAAYVFLHMLWITLNWPKL